VEYLTVTEYAKQVHHAVIHLTPQANCAYGNEPYCHKLL